MPTKMNNKLSLWITAIAITLAFTTHPACCAQGRGGQPPRHQQGGERGQRGGGGFNPTEFRQKVRDFITHEARLTTQEANIVFPIFFEIKDQQRDLHHKIDKACKRISTEHLSERDCEKILSEIKRLQRQMADLDATLIDRLRARGLAASKILAIKAADEKFRRTTFRNATHRHR